MNDSIQKVIDRFNGWPSRARYGAFAVFLVLIVALDYFSLMGLQLGYIHKSYEDLKTLSAEITRVRTDKERVDQMNKGLEMSRSQFKAMSRKVRSAQEVAVILEDISRLANEAGVKIDQLTPQRGSQETLIASPEGDYSALPIVIEAHSGYHAFGRFLNSLERADLYFSLRDLRVDANIKDQNNHLISAAIKVILVDKPQSKEADP